MTDLLPPAQGMFPWTPFLRGVLRLARRLLVSRYSENTIPWRVPEMTALPTGLCPLAPAPAGSTHGPRQGGTGVSQVTWSRNAPCTHSGTEMTSIAPENVRYLVCPVLPALIHANSYSSLLHSQWGHQEGSCRPCNDEQVVNPYLEGSPLVGAWGSIEHQWINDGLGVWLCTVMPFICDHYFFLNVGRALCSRSPWFSVQCLLIRALPWQTTLLNICIVTPRSCW